MFKSIFFYISFILSIILLLISVFLNFAIISDIPPAYTVSEIYDYYKFVAIMLLFFIITIKLASTRIYKYILILIPVIFIFILMLKNMLNNYSYTYLNREILLMDITLLLSLLSIILLDLRQYFKYRNTNTHYEKS